MVSGISADWLSPGVRQSDWFSPGGTPETRRQVGRLVFPWGFPGGKPGAPATVAFWSPWVSLPRKCPPRVCIFREFQKWESVNITFPKRSFQRNDVFHATLDFLTCRLWPPESRLSPGNSLVFPLVLAGFCRLSPGNHPGGNRGKTGLSPGENQGKSNRNTPRDRRAR